MTPGGNADVYQSKGLAGKAICKTMKTKGRQNRFVRSGQRVAAIPLGARSDFCHGSETAGGAWGTLASEKSIKQGIYIKWSNFGVEQGLGEWNECGQYEEVSPT